ncbi:MAG: hypothetical protein Q8S35_00325 [bacterium]|nr:hypothetical protein [bacterium]
MKPGSVLVRTGLVVILLLVLASGVRADFIFEPRPADTFESLQYLAFEVTSAGQPLATSSIPSATPLTISYQVGYGDRMFTHPDHTPETRAQYFQHMLEDNTTYLEIWSGEPFTPEATLVESKQTGPETSGTVTFAPLEPGDYFLVYFSSQEIRDRTAYCVRYEVPAEECADPVYVTEYPVAESRIYFNTPIASLNDVADIQPTNFAGFRLTVEGPVSGVSNVLFLPGIKGSRLYDGFGNKLWEPFGNHDLGALYLDAHGKSARNDIHVKEGDIVSQVFGNNFYASFVNQMNALEADGMFVDWRAVAYDWRLSLDDIVSRGVVRNERVYFQEETDTPYIEQTLKELAATSPTGKVSIIAHSNGGLVTKKLMQRLEANGEADLVDQIILVGVPQSGAPQAMAGLLYGYGEALPADRCAENILFGRFCSFIGSRDVARALAEHSPMAYHLLPSQAYFDQVNDVDHPVAKFTALTAYAEERDRYGASVDSSEELYAFLEALDGGRSKPAVNDTANANVLHASFLNYARSAHSDIDSWVPPLGVVVHQIAGWGMNTVAGVEFYEQKKLFGGYREMYRPIFVEDGDKVVPVPSALLMSSENVESYWIDLQAASFGDAPNLNHSNLYESGEVRTLIRDLLLKNDFELPEFISRSQPEPLHGNRLIFFLHSPLTLEIYDEEGNHVGEDGQGGFNEEIPNVEYGEFGDVKYIIAPAGEYSVVMHGKDSGVFSLDVQTVSNNVVTSSFTFADVPTTERTVATISVSGDLTQTGALQVDTNGDGIVDFELTPTQNNTVIYEPAVTALTEEDGRTSARSSRARNMEVASAIQETTADAVSEVLEKISSLISYVGDADQNQVTTASKSASLESIAKDPPRTQTASAYDAIGNDFMNWLGTMLYNLWENLMKMLASLLPKK